MEKEEDSFADKDGSLTSANKKAQATTRANLDDKTLKIIKDYLANGIENVYLDEEEVAFTAIKTSRYSSERSRYRKDVLDHSDLSEEETYYDRVYKEEENYALANEFFRDVVTDAELTSGEGADFELDRRSLAWLKKAAGLQRPYDPREKHASISDDDDYVEIDSRPVDTSQKSHVPGRRVTRGAAKATRVKRREEKIRQDHQGLYALVHAIDNIEKERGPFPRSNGKFKSRRRRHKRPREGKSASARRSEDTEHDGSPSRSENGRYWKRRYSKTQLVARFPNGQNSWRFSERNSHDILLRRVLVNGKHLFDSDTELDKALLERKRQKDREYQRAKREREIKRVETEALANGEPPPYIETTRAKPKERINATRRVESDHEQVTLDLFNRMCDAASLPADMSPAAAREREARGPSVDTRFTYVTNNGAIRQSQSKRRRIQIPPQSQTPTTGLHTGLATDRLPQMSADTNTEGAIEAHMGPSLVTAVHRPIDSARLCKRLLNTLNGAAKQWARYEFFYSDLDRAWFDSNDFGRALTKMGIGPDMKFTRSEWSLIRQAIPNRPKRFSTQFVLRELHKRNQHRQLIRAVQRDPNLAKHVRCDIPTTIPVGATVSAYNKRLQLIQRGKVLFHDTRFHGYLVQFERPELLHEFCPDSEVARHGPPELITVAFPTSFSNSIATFHIPSNDPASAGYQQQSRGMIGAALCASQDNTITRKQEAVDWIKSPKWALMNEDSVQGTGRTSISVHYENGHNKENEVRSVPPGIANIERQLFTELLLNAQFSLKRKEMLLQCIKKMGKSPTNYAASDGKSQTARSLSKREKSNLAWLIANLNATNKALESTLSRVDILYGPLQSKSGTNARAMQNDKKRRVDAFLREHLHEWDQSMMSEQRSDDYNSGNGHGSGVTTSTSSLGNHVTMRHMCGELSSIGTDCGAPVSADMMPTIQQATKLLIDLEDGVDQILAIRARSNRGIQRIHDCQNSHMIDINDLMQAMEASNFVSVRGAGMTDVDDDIDMKNGHEGGISSEELVQIEHAKEDALADLKQAMALLSAEKDAIRAMSILQRKKRNSLF